jgi:LmbE family N-acetylglucosaminyl deacetylase
LIQRRRAQGGEVKVLAVYGRVYDYGAAPTIESTKEEEADFRRALSVLDAGWTAILNFSGGEPTGVGYYRVLKEVEHTLTFWRPDEVVGPAADDLNQDHRFLSHVLDIALRPFNLGNVTRRLEFFSLDGTFRQPSYYVPLTEEQVAHKLKAMACYRRESRTGNSPRAPEVVRSVLRIWGSACGHEYAEAYRLRLQID